MAEDCETLCFERRKLREWDSECNGNGKPVDGELLAQAVTVGKNLGIRER